MLATVAFMLPRAAGATSLTAVRGDTTAARRAKQRSFTALQQDNKRVLEARLEKKLELKRLFRERGVAYPAAETFLRIFKRERVLEVWVRGANDAKLTLLKSYSICALSGLLGPKRMQGDGQTPEGFYYIDGFNPSSEFLLSLHIDYPNKADQARGKGNDLGGAIFIHGGCRTEGCLAVTDDAIKELYWLAVEAKNAGQDKVPVHIFPSRLTDTELHRLTQVFEKEPEHWRFWANLKPTYDYFEVHRRLPNISVDARGRYRMTAPAVLAADSPAAAPKVAGSND